MVELVDTPDLGSGAARRGGSSPSIGTKSIIKINEGPIAQLDRVSDYGSEGSKFESW